ncbi:GBP1 [Symbiodinium sp. CCMP2456]|nr:GBP1 [Symbiodinium sp. CCMP2456]
MQHLGGPSQIAPGRCEMGAGGSVGSKCVGCHGSEDLHVFETHAGRLHTACSHAACGPCLRQLVLRQLPKSRERWQLEILCPEPGCQKRLPQRLVLTVKEADDLAKAIDTDGVWPSLGDEESQHCPLCGKAAAVRVNRACGHAACETCWLDGLEEKLRWCRENAAMDIPCPHPGCHEGCYDVLRHFESPFLEELELYVREAQAQLVEISSWCVHGPPGAPGPRCPVCARQSMALLHCPCGYAACSSCWKGFVQQQLVWCQENFALGPVGCPWHPGPGGCAQDVLPVLPYAITVFAEHQDHLKKELRRLEPCALPRDLRGPAPTCPICAEASLCLLSPCSSEHVACEKCWANWAEEQIDMCRLGRHLPARCLWPSCVADLAESGMWRLVKGASVEAPRLSPLLADMDRRQRLQRSYLYPPAVQVDCPQPGCVGLGYLGFDMVMCFICEHQWDATEGILGEETELPEGEEVAEASVAGVKVKSAEFFSRFGLPPLAQVNHVQLPEDMDQLLSFLSAMGPEEALVHFVDSGGGDPDVEDVPLATAISSSVAISAKSLAKPQAYGEPNGPEQAALDDAMMSSSMSAQEERPGFVLSFLPVRRKVKKFRSEMSSAGPSFEAPVVMQISTESQEQSIYSGQLYVFQFRVETAGPLSLEIRSDGPELQVQPSSISFDVSEDVPVYISISVYAPSRELSGMRTVTLQGGEWKRNLRVRFQELPGVAQLLLHDELRGPAGPWPLLRWSGGAPQLVESTLRKLEELPPRPVAVISVVGAYRQGKSHLLNQLANVVGMGFDLGHTTRGHTEGFDCILMCHWEKDEYVLILDTEGTEDVAKNEKRSTDILVLAWSADILQAATLLAQQVQSSMQRDEEGETRSYPSLTWVVRDWALELPDGQDLQSYLEGLLPSRGISRKAKEARKTAEESVDQLEKLFPRRQMLTVIRPVADEADLQRLESPEVQRRVRPQFTQQICEACDAIRAQSRAKCVGGTTLQTGAVMTQYIREVVQAVRSGENLIIESAWARVQEALAEKALSAASKLFDEFLRAGLASLKAEIFHAKGSHLVAQFCSRSDGVPLEEEEIERIVEEASEKARARLAGLAHGCEPTRHHGVAVALQQHAIQELKQLNSENRELSEAYCSLVAQGVCTQLQSEVSSSSGTDDGLQDLLKIAVDEYGSSARGPAKCRVGHRHMERMSREVALRQDAREQLRVHQEESQHLMLLQEAQHLADMEKKDRSSDKAEDCGVFMALGFNARAWGRCSVVRCKEYRYICTEPKADHLASSISVLQYRVNEAQAWCHGEPGPSKSEPKTPKTRVL